MEIRFSKEISQNDYNKFQIEILQKQVNSLMDSICKSEEQMILLLKEKKDIIDHRFEDYLRKKLEFTEIKLADYFKESINFN